MRASQEHDRSSRCQRLVFRCRDSDGVILLPGPDSTAVYRRWRCGTGYNVALAPVVVCDFDLRGAEPCERLGAVP